MIGNIEGVVRHFAADGLTRGDYLLRGGQGTAALHAKA